VGSYTNYLQYDKSIFIPMFLETNIIHEWRHGFYDDSLEVGGEVGQKFQLNNF
jgi:hypothetical protein